MAHNTLDVSALSLEERIRLEEFLMARIHERTNGATLSPRAGTGPCALSFAQERLWFLHQLQPGLTAYNEPTAYRLRGPLDLPALQRSLTAVVERHKVLRTVYQLQNDVPVQIVQPAGPVDLPVTDLSHLGAAALSRCLELCSRMAEAPFDLSRDLMLRVGLYRLGADDYVLGLVRHHIATDAWSSSVFNRDLSAFYAAAVSGAPPTLAELPIQYADFAVWQREWLQGEVLEQKLAYWRTKLADLPTLDLPTDRPRPSRPDYAGAALHFSLPGDLADRARAFARQEGASLYMTLLAAFAAVLYRYSGQTDFAIGTPNASRDRVEVENLVGFFINTMAMRMDLSGSPSFRTLLQRVRQTALGAYDHHQVPFERLVEVLEPDRRMDRHPLFQVTFQVGHQTTDRLPNFADVEVSRLPLGFAGAKFDLAMSIRDSGAALTGFVTYRTELFHPDTIERLVGHYRTLLEAALAEPERSIRSLQLLTGAEHSQILDEWNRTTAPYPRERCVHELLEDQARQTPEAIAVVLGGQRITYAELHLQATCLARRLRALGIGPGTRVAVHMERSIDLVVGLLAVLKAGGAYVPIDAEYPAERVKFMLRDSRVSLILTHTTLLAGLDWQGPAVCLDREDAIPVDESDADLPRMSGPDDIAYIIYTSGSTGHPKGALVHHRALCNQMVWMQRAFPLSAGDRVLQKTSLSFDGSVWEFWLPLLVGATLVMMPPADQRDPSRLVDIIQASRITVLQGVPTLLRALLEERRIAACTSLRWLFSGGEALTSDLVERVYATLKLTVVNLYGPSEASINSTSYVVPRDAHHDEIPIGRPIANMRAYVLDEDLNPVPVGVAGELCVSGAGVGLGYLNRPELTAQVFVPDPFVYGERMYRTGDRAKFLPDGNLIFLGRSDHQVKVRGFRVELGEIEAALREHPAVHDVVVVAQHEIDEGARLIAYVVPKPGAAPTHTDLSRYLRIRLPDYMVPAAFVALKEIPLGPNGKVDRRSLPAPDMSRPALEKEFTPPRTPLESALAGLWARLLKLERVGVNDNFFELGGHSLLATRLVAVAGREMGLPLTVRDVFERPTVAGLAAHLTSDLPGARVEFTL